MRTRSKRWRMDPSEITDMRMLFPCTTSNFISAKTRWLRRTRGTPSARMTSHVDKYIYKVTLVTDSAVFVFGITVLVELERSKTLLQPFLGFGIDFKELGLARYQGHFVFFSSLGNCFSIY